VGLAADIVVFDEREVRDRATFAEPDLPAEGIRYVMVNGADGDRGRQVHGRRARTTAAFISCEQANGSCGEVVDKRSDAASEHCPTGGLVSRQHHVTFQDHYRYEIRPMRRTFVITTGVLSLIAPWGLVYAQKNTVFPLR
jgi:hypothetical protein